MNYVNEVFDLHPEQLPQHKIFISHSGKQKDFAEQLCKDLEAYNYRPFFDKRPDSLPKGQDFPSRIFKAAGECLLGIALLSHDYFANTKWPMMELAAFVRARAANPHTAHILPVLLQGSNDRIPGAELLQEPAIEVWSQQYWEKWAESNRNRVNADVIDEWKSSIRAIRPLNFLSQANFDGEVALRSAIVDAVVRLMPPDVRADVSHVKGKERLYEEIMAQLSKVEAPSSSSSCWTSAPRVLGVYGVSGVGKSTLCRILTHFLRAGFQGRACHVELNADQDSTLKLQIKALKQLTGAVPEFTQKHLNTKEEGWTCLKQRMSRKKIFLALDNVSDKEESLDFAKQFLRKVNYHADSMVLVTAQSKDILRHELGIPEECCMQCPHVNAQEAREIVLDHINVKEVGVQTYEQRDILQRTIKMCDFGSGFHPMALKALAAQLGGDPSNWELCNLNSLQASDAENMLFKSMGANFSRLSDQKTKDMFMDISLFAPWAVNNVHDLRLWLRDTLHSSCSLHLSCGSVKCVTEKLNVLRLKSLLEVWSIDSDNVCIHDLHRELAKRKARVDDRFVYETCAAGEDVDPTVCRWEHTERACLVGITAINLDLHICSKLQLLSVRSCHNLVDLRLQGLATLVSLELSSCPVKTLDLTELSNLKWLCLTACKLLMGLDASECKKLLSVHISKCSELESLELRNAEVLQTVSLSHNNSLQHVYLGSGKCLCRLTLWFCEVLVTVEILSESVCLSEFKKRGCPYLMNVKGCKSMSQDVRCLILTRWQKVSAEVIAALQGSSNLQVLDLWDCPMRRLPDLRVCSSLRELRLSEVDVLLESDDRALLHDYVDILCASEDDIALPTSLQEVTIGGCRNTVVKEICWKLHGLQKLEVLLLQTVRVCWDWELYRSNSKGYSQTASCLNSMSTMGPSTSDLRSRREFLHEQIDTGYMQEREGTSTSEELGEGFDEEETESDTSCEDEAVNIITTGSMPAGDESSTSEQAAVLCGVAAVTSGESSKLSEVIKYFYHVIFWIRNYLVRAGSARMEGAGIQGEVANIISEHCQAQSHLEDYEAADHHECWLARQIVRPEEMERQLHYRAPDYVFLETIDNFDTFWKQFMIQRPATDSLKLLEMVKGESIEQLRQQLIVLQGLGPGPHKYFAYPACHPWERKVSQEINLFENILQNILQSRKNAKTGITWERFAEGGNLFSSWRVQDLEERVASLMKRRRWSLPNDWREMQVESSGQYIYEQWRQDWLLSCKMCMSIQCFAMLVTQTTTRDQLALFSQCGWFVKMVQKIDCGLQNEIESVFKRSGPLDVSVMKALLRSWKARQWLQKVAATLSTKWVEAEIKEKLASSSPDFILQGLVETIEECRMPGDGSQCKSVGGIIGGELISRSEERQKGGLFILHEYLQRLIKGEIASNQHTKEDAESPILSRQADMFSLGSRSLVSASWAGGRYTREVKELVTADALTYRVIMAGSWDICIPFSDIKVLFNWIECSSKRQAVRRSQLLATSLISTREDSTTTAYTQLGGGGGLAERADAIRRWGRELMQQLAEADIASLHPSNNMEDAALHDVRDRVEAAAHVALHEWLYSGAQS